MANKNAVAVVEVVSNDLSGNVVVEFNDKKGVSHARTIEAAIHKGGQALKRVKDITLALAVQKAKTGRYRPAAEIIGDAFPKQSKAFTACSITPWASGEDFSRFVSACLAFPGGKNGLTKKQELVRGVLLAALVQEVPACRKAGITIDVA